MATADHTEMTVTQALHIFKTEIIVDDFGIYRAKKRETNSKLCAINRIRRLNALNKIYNNVTGKYPYLNWTAIPREQDDNDDEKFCICGHAIHESHIIRYIGKQTVDVAHGSECIKKVHSDFKDDPDAAKFVDTFKTDLAKLKRTCPTCKSNKFVKDTHCGGAVCKIEEMRKKAEEWENSRAEREQKLREERENSTKDTRGGHTLPGSTCR